MSADVRLQIKTVAVLEEGCFSVLLWDGRPRMVAVERTFESNRIVIPNGIILARRDFYHAGGYETFELQINGHDRVLFHAGNTEDDSRACVIPGRRFDDEGPKLAVRESKLAFERFMSLAVGLNEFHVWVSGR